MTLYRQSWNPCFDTHIAKTPWSIYDVMVELPMAFVFALSKQTIEPGWQFLGIDEVGTNWLSSTLR
jgi:hypothetical protein